MQMNKDEILNNYQIFTLTDLETVLRVSHRTLLTYVKDGKLKAFKIGNKWRVTKGDLKDFIQKNQKQNNKE